MDVIYTFERLRIYFKYKYMRLDIRGNMSSAEALRINLSTYLPRGKIEYHVLTWALVQSQQYTL